MFPACSLRTGWLRTHRDCAHGSAEQGADRATERPALQAKTGDRVHTRFFGQAAAIRRAFHRANSSHRKFFQQVFSASSAFAPRTDHLHPDLLRRVATVFLQQLSTCPHPIDLHAARPVFVVAHPLLVRPEAVDGLGHVLVPVTMRTQVRDDASDVAVQQPSLDLRQARLVRVIAPDRRLEGRRGVFQRVEPMPNSA